MSRVHESACPHLCGVIGCKNTCGLLDPHSDDHLCYSHRPRTRNSFNVPNGTAGVSEMIELMHRKVEEVTGRRAEHVSGYVAAYLVSTGADPRTLELCEVTSADGRTVSWFLRPKPPRIMSKDLPPQPGDDKPVGDPKNGITWGRLFGRRT